MMLPRHARQVRELGADVVRLRRMFVSGDRSARLAERVAFFAPSPDRSFDPSGRVTVRNAWVD